MSRHANAIAPRPQKRNINTLVYLRIIPLSETFPLAIDHCAAKDSVYSVPQYTDGPATYARLRDDNRDLGCEFYAGVVAKRADSLYPLQACSPEKETALWMKHRWKF